MSELRSPRAFYAGHKELLKQQRAKAELWLSESTDQRAQVLTDEDRIRLSRVLALLDRYEPKHPAYQLEAISAEVATESVDYLQLLRGSLQRILQSVVRSLRRTPEAASHDSGPVSIMANADTVQKRSAKAYLLAQELVATLRQLRSIDARLGKEYEAPSILELAEQRHRGEKIADETLSTPITLDYQKEQWGIERICLDGVQNHLPADALGTQVGVVCEVDGKWLPLAVARAHPEQITAVRFVDDGVGYDAKNLELFWSGKSDDDEAAGEFGEGTKMLAAAALRAGMEVQFASQDWEAKPFAKSDTIYDTRKKRKVDVQRLMIGVDRFAGDQLKGSHTTFRKLTPDFVKEVLGMPSKVLPLQENYRPAFSCPTGEVVSVTDTGKIYVKGIFVTTADTALSYNITDPDIEINRDRNTIVSGLGNSIDQIMVALDRPRVIAALLQKMVANPKVMEASLWSQQPFQYPAAWRKAFVQLYGPEAVLDTGHRPPDSIQWVQKKVTFPEQIRQRLVGAKIVTDTERLPTNYKERIKTSLTTEYGKGTWGVERILLDAVQNHLPGDTGGSALNIRFQDSHGEWHAYSSLKQFEDGDIVSIIVEDDGRGYDHQKLGLLLSDKSAEGAGKFGEGLKMITAACLRLGIDIKFVSRQWAARAGTEHVVVDGKEAEQVVFDVNHDLKNYGRQGSATVLSNLNPELVAEFRDLGKKVLDLEHYRGEELQVPAGAVLSYDEGLLFVKRILIPGKHDLLFSYHLPNLDLTNRDRNTVPRDALKAQVGLVLGQSDRDGFVRQFLFLAERAIAKGDPDPNHLEFVTPFEIKHADLWKENFQTNFGENTAIRPASSLDFDAVGQLAHVGLKVITVPDAVYASLLKIGLPSYEERLRELNDVEWLNEQALTPQERMGIALLRHLESLLPNNQEDDIRVFVAKRAGQQVALGLSSGGLIGLNRMVFTQGVEYLVDVYFHEKTHQNTNGAEDASRDFRNYLTLALAQVSLKLLELEQPGSTQQTSTTSKPRP